MVGSFLAMRAALRRSCQVRCSNRGRIISAGSSARSRDGMSWAASSSLTASPVNLAVARNLAVSVECVVVLVVEHRNKSGDRGRVLGNLEHRSLHQPAVEHVEIADSAERFREPRRLGRQCRIPLGVDYPSEGAQVRPQTAEPHAGLVHPAGISPRRGLVVLEESADGRCDRDLHDLCGGRV